MQQPQKTIRIEDVCSILEIPISTYGVNEHMAKESAEKALQNFKDLCKKQHRVLVKKYHPDLPSSGEYEEGRMKEINNVIDLVMQLKIRKVVQGPRPVSFHFSYSTFSGNWEGDSTSSSFTGFHYRYR